VRREDLQTGYLSDFIQDALIVVDAHTGRIVLWNPAAEVVFGYTQDEAIGMAVETLVPPALRGQHRFGLQRYAETGRGSLIDARRPLELPALRKTGEQIDLELTLGPVDARPGDRLVVAVVRDVTERKRLERQLADRTHELAEANEALKELATTDGLTGLANRERAVHMLEKFVLLAKREERPLSLAFLDVDHFKDVNDHHGHLVGDEVLRRLGSCLMGSFRGEDIVARWGGEEFIVGMYGMAKSAAVKRVTSVLASFRTEDFTGPDGAVFHVTCSAGVAEYPTDADGTTTLFVVADEALYAAKEHGRNCVFAAGTP
jgi:diguanylate cyclase (GGDEF)-like protein/PAS domain S-box-containing protein